MDEFEKQPDKEKTPEDISNLDNIESYILFFVDKNQEVGYNADWSGGINGFAEMFFSMSYGSLLDEILHDMEQECVKLGKVEEFQKILSVLANKLRQRNVETDSIGDSVVVPPLSDLYYQ
jgi:hypothetical protein